MLNDETAQLFEHTIESSSYRINFGQKHMLLRLGFVFQLVQLLLDQLRFAIRYLDSSL
jgi:hypothetical protein